MCLNQIKFVVCMFYKMDLNPFTAKYSLVSKIFLSCETYGIR